MALKIILGGLTDNRIRDKLYGWQNKSPSTTEILKFIRKEEQMMPRYNPALNMKTGAFTRRANANANAVANQEDQDSENGEDTEDQVAAWNSTQGKKKKQQKKKPQGNNGNQQHGVLNNGTHQVAPPPFYAGRPPGSDYASAANSQGAGRGRGRGNSNPNLQCTFCGRIGHVVNDCLTVKNYAKQAQEDIESKKQARQNRTTTDGAAGVSTYADATANTNNSNLYQMPGNF
jgi:hypothetical protein